MSDSLETRTRQFLAALLMDVPILRAGGEPQDYLNALERAILFYPVFPGSDSPVDGWLTEAEKLSRALGKPEKLGSVLLRRAGIQMRCLDLEEATSELSALEGMLSALPPSYRAWHAITRSRVLTRQRQFDAARQSLATVDPLVVGGWMVALPAVTEGELELEVNNLDAAKQALRRALAAVPFELVEERVGVLQGLGFVAIAEANAPAALSYLDEARQILRGAGAWTEVVQMNIAVGAFLTSAGEQASAQSLFTEALTLSKSYPQPHLETLVRLGLVRSKAASGQFDEAVVAALEVVRLYAVQGNVLGYVSTIMLMANLYLQAKRYEDAYRTLVTGIAIAKKRTWSVAEDVLRRQIQHLRDETMGPEQFDVMVQAMVDDKRRGN